MFNRPRPGSVDQLEPWLSQAWTARDPLGGTLSEANQVMAPLTSKFGGGSHEMCDATNNHNNQPQSRTVMSAKILK